ncbi:hypothetical protein ABZX40_05890 [Streptomyces sp. NPDC004610]|uniref:hypothetical protein n=1 Tax=unclassified Streptomyces TaxID=2593676 RepID=UPI0033A75503
MATTDTDQTAVPPQDCGLGTLVKDIDRDLVGVVMGHYGSDRVQLRPINGGTEWDAFTVSPLTAREELRVRNAARNAASRQRL